MRLVHNGVKVLMMRLHRYTCSRGFGVHSPWAYNFIRYVVNEHWPYYEYERLAESFSGIDKVTRKLCLFYFRIANYCQPTIILDYAPEENAYSAYFKAGSNRANVVRIDVDAPNDTFVDTLEKCDGALIVRISLTGDYRENVEMVMDRACSNFVLILQGIYKSPENRRFWNKIISDERTGVTFDLYHCGIVFFDKEIYKQDYMAIF